jgi:hypothetical protein
MFRYFYTQINLLEDVVENALIMAVSEVNQFYR